MDDVEKKQRPARRTSPRTAPAVPVETDDLADDVDLVDDAGWADDAEEGGAPGDIGGAGGDGGDEGVAGETQVVGSRGGRVGRLAIAGRGRPAIMALIGGALIVLVVAGLVLSILEWTNSSNRYNSDKSLRSSALSAATTYGVYLSSYDYKNLNGPHTPWAEVDAHSTAAFRKTFDSTKSTLAGALASYKATATAKVIAAGLSSVSSNRAVVLLFINQTITNTAQKSGPSTQPFGVEVVLARQHGKWLIDNLLVRT